MVDHTKRRSVITAINEGILLFTGTHFSLCYCTCRHNAGIVGAGNGDSRVSGGDSRVNGGDPRVSGGDSRGSGGDGSEVGNGREVRP